MDFTLDPDQLAFREEVRRLARGELAGGYQARAASSEFPWRELQRLAGLGVLGLAVSDPDLGTGRADYLLAGVAVEEVAYADFNVAMAMIPSLLAAAMLAAHGGREVRERWLEPVLAGREYVGLGLTEPGSGSDAAALRTTARRDGDFWVLNGEKTSITGVPHLHAMVTLAKVDGRDDGVSAFLVPAAAEGVSMTVIPDFGWVPVGRGSVFLEGVKLPAAAMLGGVGDGFRSILAEFDITRPYLALGGIGCAQAAIDETAEYVEQRHAFGSPLSRFEGVSFTLAEHAAHLHVARLVCYEALSLRSQGKRATKEAAMAKWLGPMRAVQAIHDCLLLHGHYGYSTDSALPQRLRDVLSVEIADGTAQVQKMIIARELFGRSFLPYAR